MSALAGTRPAAWDRLQEVLEGRRAIVRELDRETLAWREPSADGPAPAILLELLTARAVPAIRREDLEELEGREAVELHPAEGAPLLFELVPLGEGTGEPEYPDGPYRCGTYRPWPGPCSSCREEWRGFLFERAQEADARSLLGRCDVW